MPFRYINESYCQFAVENQYCISTLACLERFTFFATTVNYLDRQVLSLLAPSLSEESVWTNSDYAKITAVFQFVYAISMLFAGRIIDKLEPNGVIF